MRSPGVVKVAAAGAAREAGSPTRAASLLSEAVAMIPRWGGRREVLIECEARKVLANGSDFYFAHYLHAQCLSRQGDEDLATDGRSLTYEHVSRAHVCLHI